MLSFIPQDDCCKKIKLAIIISGFKYKWIIAGNKVHGKHKCIIPAILLLSMNTFHYKLINLQVVKLELE